MKSQYANGGRKGGKEVGLLHWEEGKAVSRWREALPRFPVPRICWTYQDSILFDLDLICPKSSEVTSVYLSACQSGEKTKDLYSQEKHHVSNADPRCIAEYHIRILSPTISLAISEQVKHAINAFRL